MEKFKKAETIEGLITNIENRDYECEACFLKNDADFIKLKSLVKKLTIKDIYKTGFRKWVKDNFTRMGNVYLDKEGGNCRESQLEAKYKTQLLLHL